MKKPYWAASLFLGALLCGVSPLFSEEPPKAKTTDQAIKPHAGASSEHDAFDEKNLYNPQPKVAPVATVAVSEKKAVHASAAKSAATKVASHTAKPVAKVSPAKKAAEPKKKAEPATAEVAAMEKRWKVIFSKDVTKDSISYTVKSGDSFYVIAKKHHTTVDLIKKINGMKSDNLYAGTKLKVHTAPFSILVDKSKNTLTLFSDGLPVKKYSVATGKNNSTPVGTFEIKDKLLNPTWFKTGAILPPGSPENGLGTRWMGFDKPSYGIHGTIDPKSIGTQASEGCVRMLNEDVEELYSIVPMGTKVTIQD